ncbi:DUF4406 domain-containing protein [Mycolicibacterium peregrinum]|nr:DUF4406 domain-containing protein [Mycolicibacterium peregrinum]
MTGIPDFNYPMFNVVAQHLRGLGHKVQNPAENDGGSSDKPWQFYMRLALRQLLDCDEVMLLPGWQNSRGARIEESVARALGMTVREWGRLTGPRFRRASRRETDAHQ